jgi:hypothetical protein
MIQHVTSGVDGAALFGIISVCLFFVVFTGAIIFAVTRNKSLCRTMSALPLEDENAKGPSNE